LQALDLLFKPGDPSLALRQTRRLARLILRCALAAGTSFHAEQDPRLHVGDWLRAQRRACHRSASTSVSIRRCADRHVQVAMTDAKSTFASCGHAAASALGSNVPTADITGTRGSK
jgi:hypothetical protein